MLSLSLLDVLCLANLSISVPQEEPQGPRSSRKTCRLLLQKPNRIYWTWTTPPAAPVRPHDYWLSLVSQSRREEFENDYGKIHPIVKINSVINTGAQQSPTGILEPDDESAGLCAKFRGQPLCKPARFVNRHVEFGRWEIEKSALLERLSQFLSRCLRPGLVEGAVLDPDCLSLHCGCLLWCLSVQKSVLGNKHPQWRHI